MASQHVPRKKRVAVIGSGLAGLTAAHLLTEKQRNNDGIEVHIFEKAQSIGMDSASIDVFGDDGKIHRVDSPMRAVQGGELFMITLLRIPFDQTTNVSL